MTACTNHGGKARRVVTAALVGVLSVGTVPMVALAAGANDGIETQAVSWGSGATVTQAQDGKGNILSGNLDEQVFTQGSGKFLVPTEVSNAIGDKTAVDPTNYTFTYGGVVLPTGGCTYEGENGTVFVAKSGSCTLTYEEAEAYFSGEFKDSSDNAIVPSALTYSVTISDGTDTTTPVYFKISQGTIEGVQVKGTVVYNGTDLSDDIAFVDASGNDVVATSVVYFDAQGHTVGSASDVNGNTGGQLVNAGSYVAELKVGAKSYNVPFTVEKLDLSEASLYVKDQKVGAINDKASFFRNLEINGTAVNSALQGELDVTKVVNAVGGSQIGDTNSGQFQVTVSSKGGKNVEGSGTVSYYALNIDVFTDKGAKIYYGSNPVSSTLKFSVVDGESFDASKLSVRDASGKALYKGDQLEVTYSDGTKTVDASALANKGDYDVYVRVKPVRDFATNLLSGGSDDIDVEIVPVSLNADVNLGFYIDGEIAGSTETVAYDGSDWLEKIATVVKDSEGNTLTEGTDYEVKVTKDGKEVDSIVDAGTYKLEVTGLTFDFSSGTDSLTLTVNPVKLERLVADTKDMLFEAKDNGLIPEVEYDADSSSIVDNEYYVAYTGSAVEIPAVKYEVKSGSNYSYVTLDSSLYNVVSIEKGGKQVKEAVEPGTYTVKIALTDAADGNYSLLISDSEFTFTVRSYGHFTDVNASKWYAQVVEQAYKKAYVNGIAGTNLFAPEADITRADVACILFNMAGGTSAFGDDEFGFTENSGYVTGFDDVDGHAYYAQAIAWAHTSGVVNGHDGNFRPTDKITREEFASMLANFAKSKGEDVTSDGSALAAMSDASSVSDWAEANVAWAVENGIMGNGGSVNATAKITRAEVAAMAVNYQPQSLTGYNRDNMPKA